MFLNQIEFEGQVIKEQYFDGQCLWLVTLNSDNGKYSLWKEGKFLGESKDLLALKDKGGWRNR